MERETAAAEVAAEKATGASASARSAADASEKVAKEANATKGTSEADKAAVSKCQSAADVENRPLVGNVPRSVIRT